MNLINPKVTTNDSDDVLSICKACGICEKQQLKAGTLCAGISKEAKIQVEYPSEFPKTYTGIRFTADAMDCALPISIDSHSGCSYNCLYCFSNNLSRAPDRNPQKLQQLIREGTFYSEWDIKRLEKFLAREAKDKISQAMYPLLDAGVPVQFGALGDPFDDLELHSGWAKKAIPLFIKYGVPVRISTKGAKALQQPDYLKLFEANPAQFWVAFSIISNSDDLISKIDINAPNTSERLKAMKALTSLGCHASLRFRPFIPGISDAYPGEPKAWRVLIERARESGAEAISFEYIFLMSVLTPRQREMYRLMFKVLNNPKFGDQWHSISDPKETCRRATREFKYEMTKNVRDTVHRLGMRFGISDPHFKEWNDTGCCCGMPEDGDPWFSRWSRRQMTEVLVQARRAWERGEERLFNYDDWRPEWSHHIKFTDCVNVKSWHTHRRLKYYTFGDSMRRKWNDPLHPRGPFKYFKGVIVPVGKDEYTGDLVYKYQNWTPNHIVLPNQNINEKGNL